MLKPYTKPCLSGKDTLNLFDDGNNVTVLDLAVNMSEVAQDDDDNCFVES